MTKTYRKRAHGGASYEPELKEFVVDVWGSKPFTNDDCWTGYDFGTIEDALDTFENPGENSVDLSGVAFIVIDGPGIHKERRVAPDCNGDDASDDDWKREQAMQAGMAFGCAGYNDSYGY